MSYGTKRNKWLCYAVAVVMLLTAAFTLPLATGTAEETYGAESNGFTYEIINNAGEAEQHGLPFYGSGAYITGYNGTSATAPLTLGEQSVVFIELNSCNLASVDVTACTGLKYLNCASNPLSTLNVSKNIVLEYLDCSFTHYGYTHLDTLDVSKNIALKELRCRSSKLNALNLETNTALEYLDCRGNELGTLDVRKNTALEYLDCSYNSSYSNKLNALDVSKNIALKELNCMINQLSELNVSSNSTLEILYCGGNQLSGLNVSENTALEYLECYGNQLTALDVSQNIALEYLDCSDNQLTTLEVSANTALEDLHCSENKLTTLDLSQNTELETLYCYDNKLTTLSLNQNTALKNLFCRNNQLAALEIGQNTELEYLHCSDNKLTALNVNNSTALETFYCSNNKLAALDVSHNTSLKELYCDVNQLTELNVSSNTALETFYCNGNKLTTLNVSNNTALKSLSCGYNQLTTLDVHQNTALRTLSCLNNQLTTLDVSQNPALETLSCSNNQLTRLDVSQNPALGHLYCPNNRLTTLDVSNNSAIYYFDCTHNRIMDTVILSNLINRFGESRVLPQDISGLTIYTITFNAQSGNVSPASAQTGADGKLTSLPTPTRAGYIFKGWFTSDGAPVTTAIAFSANTTVYAHWTPDDPINYTVTFDANSGSMSSNTKTIVAGAAIGTLPSPTRTGYTFKGWFTEPSGGTQISESTPVTTNITYYAQWESVTSSEEDDTSDEDTPPVQFTITFNANGGAVSTKTATIAGGAKLGALPSPKREGHAFKGWYTAKSGGTKISADTVVNADATYYAQWQAKTYKATFNANKGKISKKAKLTKSVKYDTKLGKLPTPTRKGYKFKGWYTKKSGGAKIKAATKMPAKNVTYYAQWKRK